MVSAVFLDRDGTLNQEKGYIRQVEDLALLPGAAEAIRLFQQAGILTILTTNQTGTARGFYPESHIQALNQRLDDLLEAEAGVRLDAQFYCPHLEKSTLPEYGIACTCRKPEIGMIRQAQERFPTIDLTRSFVIGDKASDLELALNAGCQGVLVKTGYGQRVLEGKYQFLKATPSWVCEDVLEAARQIVASLSPAGAESRLP